MTKQLLTGIASRIRENPIAFGVATSTISGIIRGSFNPETYSIFIVILETEPEMLDKLFETD